MSKMKGSAKGEAVRIQVDVKSQAAANKAPGADLAASLNASVEGEEKDDDGEHQHGMYRFNSGQLLDNALNEEDDLSIEPFFSGRSFSRIFSCFSWGCKQESKGGT